MSTEDFAAWLGTDRSSPVPDFEPRPIDTLGRIWLSCGPEDDYTVTQLWCAEHTSSGRDYLGEWVNDPDNPHKNDRAITAAIRKHAHEHHGGPEPHEITTEPVRTMSGGPFYRSTCSCGQYRSSPCGSPQKAARRGQAHADAKKAAHDD